MPPVIPPFSFFKFLLRVILKAGWLIFILVVIESSLDQWITGQMQNFLANPDGMSPWVYFYGLLSMLVSLFFPSALMVIVVTSLKDSWSQVFEDLNFVMIESLRAWGKALLWGFVLVLPGIYKWLRLSLVPVVVMLSPAYQSGKVDALEESEQASQGELLSIVILFFLLSGLAPFLFTNFEEFKTIWRTPLAAIAYHLVQSLIGIVFCLWLVKIYQKKAVIA